RRTSRSCSGRSEGARATAERRSSLASRIPLAILVVGSRQSARPHHRRRCRMCFRAPVSLDALNRLGRNTLVEHLGIVFSAAGDDWLQATMPVEPRTLQPYGLLHGGASVVLAETLGSSAGNLCLDPAL